MKTTGINEDNLLTAVIIGSSVLALLFTISGWLLFSKATGFGIAAGSCLAILNFVWQRNIMQRILGLRPDKPAMYATVRYLLRLAVTAVLLYFILTSGLFSVAGLLVGLSVVVIMIVICTVYFTIHKGD